MCKRLAGVQLTPVLSTRSDKEKVAMLTKPKGRRALRRSSKLHMESGTYVLQVSCVKRRRRMGERERRTRGKRKKRKTKQENGACQECFRLVDR